MRHNNLLRIEGISLSLRLVQPQDAAYIHALRMNSAYNTHLSTVSDSVQDQADWITSYKTREAAGSEYYYVIERRKDARPCGVVRLYDITSDQFTWGSWILDHNKPPKAALESAVLIYKLGFQVLGKTASVFDVRRDNLNTLAFHRRFGALETGQSAQDVFLNYHKAQFERDIEDHMAVLYTGPIQA